jgi:hypothetical protein
VRTRESMRRTHAYARRYGVGSHSAGFGGEQ